MRSRQGGADGVLMAEHYDVIIAGTGADGGTLANTLAPSGKRILLLERGDFLPRETDNWDARAVFVDGKYISPDTGRLGPRRRLQGPRAREPLRGRHQLLPQHRGGEPRTDRDGQRHPGRRAPADPH